MYDVAILLLAISPLGKMGSLSFLLFQELLDY